MVSNVTLDQLSSFVVVAAAVVAGDVAGDVLYVSSCGSPKLGRLLGRAPDPCDDELTTT